MVGMFHGGRIQSKVKEPDDKDLMIRNVYDNFKIVI